MIQNKKKKKQTISLKYILKKKRNISKNVTYCHVPKFVSLWKAQSWEDNSERTKTVVGMKFIGHIILKVRLQTKYTSDVNFTVTKEKPQSLWYM